MYVYLYMYVCMHVHAYNIWQDQPQKLLFTFIHTSRPGFLEHDIVNCLLLDIQTYFFLHLSLSRTIQYFMQPSALRRVGPFAFNSSEIIF